MKMIFNYTLQNANPGPGSYGNLRVAVDKTSSSLSKKGLGVGFVSKVRTFKILFD